MDIEYQNVDLWGLWRGANASRLTPHGYGPVMSYLSTLQTWKQKVLLNSIIINVTDSSHPAQFSFLFSLAQPTNQSNLTRVKSMENQTFYGDGLTSEALQYQFKIFFKLVQEH